VAGPLQGIRILDFTVLTAGAEATGYLCDLGAEVIKVEPLSGEVGRRLTPLPEGESTFFLPQNRGKRAIALDLRKPEGRAVALKLAESCDAVVHNFRVGAIERLGLGYDDLKRVNPSIVYAAGTSYGAEGPEAELESVDILGQARSGLMSVTGEDHPVPAGNIACDFGASMQLAIGLLGALIWKIRTGEGQRVESSMLGAMITAQAWEMTHFLVTGNEPGRGGRGHHLLNRGFWGVYDTEDGYAVLAGLDMARLADLSQALAAPELLAFAEMDGAERPAAMPAIKEALKTAIARHKTRPLVDALLALGVRCAPVQSYAEVARDPQVLANQYIVDIDHPRFGKTRMTGNPLRFSQTPIELAASAPCVGQDSVELLTEAGYAREEIDRLYAEAVVA
jgi:crotonobetainyl-CoA:carnitine CoA-transferase CaiB-like acyl-CoA transferase